MPVDEYGNWVNELPARGGGGAGTLVAGLGSEIGIAGASQLLGAATGGIGYLALAFGGGMAGSIANQKINNEPISLGRAIAAGIINLVPGSAGIKAGKNASKVKKLLANAAQGLNNYQGKTIPHRVFREAVKGAGFGTSEIIIEKIIDEDRLPTPDELTMYMGTGFVLGGALGGTLSSIGQRSLGKSINETEHDLIVDLVDSWDNKNFRDKVETALDLDIKMPEDISAFVKRNLPNLGPGEVEKNPNILDRLPFHLTRQMEKVLDKEFNSLTEKAKDSFVQLNLVKAFLYNQDPTTEAGKIQFAKLKSYLSPGRIFGTELHNKLDAIQGKVNEMENLGSRIRSNITHYMEKNPNDPGAMDQLAEYVTKPRPGDPGVEAYGIDQVRDKVNGRFISRAKLPTHLESFRGDLDTWRELRTKYQQELIPFLEPDAVRSFVGIDDQLAFAEVFQPLADTVKDSVKMQNYFTTEYRLFTDATYEPTKEQYRKLINHFIKEDKKISLRKKQPEHYPDWARSHRKDARTGEQKPLEGRDLLRAQQKQAKEFIEKRYLSRSKNINNRPGVPAPPDSGQSTLGNVDILDRQNSLPDVLIDFLGGEIKDTGEKIFGTGVRIAKTLAKFQAEELLVRDLAQRNLIRIDSIKLNDKFVDMRSPKLNFENPKNVHLVDGRISIEAPEVVAKALENLKETNFMGEVIDKQVTGIRKVLAEIYQPLVGLSKATKVVLNPASYATNLLGAEIAALASGNFNLLGKDVFRGIRASFDEFGSIEGWAEPIGRAVSKTSRLGMSSKAVQEMRSDIGKMQRYGMMNKDVTVGDTMRALEDGSVGRFIQKGLDPFSKAYQVSDNALRYVVWKGNTTKLKKMFSRPEGMELVKYNDEIERGAAFLTNATYQNYDKLAKPIRVFAKVGLMPPFVAFSAELTRNLFNNTKAATYMMFGKFGRDLGLSSSVLANANRGEMFKEGITRLTMIGALTYGTYKAVNYINEEGGVDRETMNALKNTVIPEYDRDKELIIEMNPDGKSGHYINASYINPFAFFNSFVRAYQDGTNTIGSLSGVAKVISNEFTGRGNFVFHELGSLVRNSDEYDNPITLKEDGVGKAADLAKYFFGELLKPGAWRELDKWVDALNNVGDNETKDLVHRMLGIRKTSFNLEEDPKWKIRPSKERLTMAEGRYFHAQRQTDMSPERKAQEYQEANSVRLASMEKMQTIYDSLKVLGMSEDNAIGIMKDNRVRSSDIIQLSQNNIQDLELSREDSLSDKYEELSGDTFRETRENIIENTRENPMLKKSLLNKLKKEQLYDRRGVTMFDRQLLGLGVSERAETLMNVLGVTTSNMALIREYRRKGIITDDVLKAIRLREMQPRY
jgi:hypothetical protein